MPSSGRKAFTLIEMAVVCGVISLLIAILLPAVQAARETGRRLACSNQMRQVSLAIASYSSQNEYFPPIACQTDFGFKVGSRSPSAHSLSVFARVLPHLDHHPLYDSINLGPIPTLALGLSSNHTAMTTHLGALCCPSDSAFRVAGYGRVNLRINVGPSMRFSPILSQAISYAGPFTVHEVYRPADFGDGLSNVVGISERQQGDWRSDSLKIQGDYRLATAEPILTEPSVQQVDSWCNSGTVTYAIESRGGESWFLSGLHFTNYNHFTTPNPQLPACSFDEGTEPIHGRSLHSGNFPASSFHGGGVLVSALDGSVHFIRDNVNLEVWRAIGTRTGRTNHVTPW